MIWCIAMVAVPLSRERSQPASQPAHNDEMFVVLHITGACATVSILFGADRYRHVSVIEQFTLFKLSSKSPYRILESWIMCFAIDGWSTSVPLHPGTTHGGILYCCTSMYDGASSTKTYILWQLATHYRRFGTIKQLYFRQLKTGL